jgi:hypothetical protein
LVAGNEIIALRFETTKRGTKLKQENVTVFFKEQTVTSVLILRSPTNHEVTEPEDDPRMRLSTSGTVFTFAP